MSSPSTSWDHRYRWTRWLLLCVTALVPLASCEKSDTPETPATPRGASQSAASGDAGESTPKITGRIMSWSQIEEFLASHPGKIVVADIWSTSCIPCMRELPHLFELKKKHPEKIVAVSINIDYAGFEDEPPEKAKEKAEAFLKRCAGAEAGIHLVSSTEDTKVYELAEIPSVPAVLVYGPDGKVVKKFGIDGDEFSYAETITPFVEKLLAGEGTEESSSEEGAKTDGEKDGTEGSSGASSSKSEESRRIHVQGHSISLVPPEGWVPQPVSMNILTFAGPAMDGFATNFTVGADPYDGTPPLKDLPKQSRSDFPPGVKLLEDGFTKIDGRKAYFVRAALVVQGVDVINKQYFVPVDQVMYSVSFAGAADAYLRLKPIWRSVVESIRFDAAAGS